MRVRQISLWTTLSANFRRDGWRAVILKTIPGGGAMPTPALSLASRCCGAGR
ncbi:hypothetical protein I553_6616 [Mycobacterium xenopi 4042]|uniref:Uncharacterized protein n=1 Tax=Mycobacterium xenopi 4042 TaxID=1299334 RepID=X8BH22_MYCXE|nr:hypothetical protein I553_6616 [Mycobacterium xenopi 4042]